MNRNKRLFQNKKSRTDKEAPVRNPLFGQTALFESELQSAMLLSCDPKAYRVYRRYTFFRLIVNFFEKL